MSVSTSKSAGGDVSRPTGVQGQVEPELQISSREPLEEVLTRLVSRGTITSDQQSAILAEMGQPPGGAGIGAPHTPRRPLSQMLIEVGLYVGSGLVVAAGFVLAAQNWEDFSKATQVLCLVATAVVTGALGLFLARGSRFATARRRLAGVLLAGTAVSCAGTVVVVVGEDFQFVAAAAFGVALLVMVVAQLVAASAVTELGMFGTGFFLLQALTQTIMYPPDELYLEPSTAAQLLPLIVVAYGLLWAGLVAPRLSHRETAVALGLFVAVMSAIPIAGQMPTRTAGLATLAVLTAVGFWRFLVESFWPWLAAAIVSLTAFVFWAVGGADRPALAILVAGLVLLGSSAVGFELGRHRHRRAETHSAGPPLERIS